MIDALVSRLQVLQVRPQSIHNLRTIRFEPALISDECIPEDIPKLVFTGRTRHRASDRFGDMRGGLEHVAAIPQSAVDGLLSLHLVALVVLVDAQSSPGRMELVEVAQKSHQVGLYNLEQGWMAALVAQLELEFQRGSVSSLE